LLARSVLLPKAVEPGLFLRMLFTPMSGLSLVQDIQRQPRSYPSTNRSPRHDKVRQARHVDTPHADMDIATDVPLL
jgi:hypothetical protein